MNSKVALITGGGSGIGRAMGDALLVERPSDVMDEIAEVAPALFVASLAAVLQEARCGGAARGPAPPPPAGAWMMAAGCRCGGGRVGGGGSCC